MPNVIVVPHSATVVRRPEHLDLQTSVNSIRTRLGKRDVIFPSRPGSPQPQRSRTLRLSIIRKLLRRSLELSESKDRQMDTIFGIHAKHQQQELKRRKTDGDLRTRTKITISAPILSPPAPDEPTLKRHEDRQAEWKESSAALKNKQIDDRRKKRWSLRTWKIESGREQNSKTNASDQSNGSKAAEAVPQSMAKRAWRYSRQKWSFQAGPEKLDVPRSTKDHVRARSPVKHHPGRIENLKHGRKAQVAQKPVISQPLRTPEHPGKYLAVPPRHGAQPVNDQSHIHPALRTNGSCLDLSSSSKESVSLTPVPSQAQPVPRVRITPPSTLVQTQQEVNKYSIIPSKPPTMQEQTILVRSINSTRAAASATPLDLHPLLSNRAQDYVGLCLPPLPPPKPNRHGYRQVGSSWSKHSRYCVTQIENVQFKSPSTASAVRLISPPGLGMLACGELWASGKNKRHKTVRHGHVPANHRYTLLPGFEFSERKITSTQSSSREPGIHGAHWCGCAEWDAWKAVTDAKWKTCGIGRAADGRWIVELWQPEGGKAAD